MPEYEDSKLFPGAHGSITFKLGWRWAWQTFTIHGGPYHKFEKDRDTDKFGVCLRRESFDPCHVYLPIIDFGVPAKPTDWVGKKLRGVIQAALNGKDVYIGCAGGWGRTGLILAVVSKILGESDPVRFVRNNYSSHAIETPQQELYVLDFDVTEVRRSLQIWVWKRKLCSLWPF